MSMLGHRVRIAVVFNNGDTVNCSMDFDNEVRVNLAKKADLFCQMSDWDDFLEKTMAGFVDSFGLNDEFWECGSPEDFDYFLEELSEYDIDDICAVILLTNHDGYERSLEWIKYSFHPYSSKVGTGKLPADDRYGIGESEFVAKIIRG